eukprot:CAMPEP_0116843112 /NCGR_PEP_ID=MMETSP0418-20121206/11903_1 /TAXON_ID=1158023 /ORGANISM="Astrosyne radiata, Strain 13vi08-1A" /LENGTH=133 /DNA_ID=CAMNT_0004473821 /DNA_START=114 /DNA_END=515 /DNA_ORIENTATION=-
MDSIEYWHAYNFSNGWDRAIQDWYAPDGKVTVGVRTMPPKEFYGEFDLDLADLKVDVREIECDADGEWCHLKVYTTFFGNNEQEEETVSIPQYWTYLYDPVTCRWAHYILLARNNDMEYLLETLGNKDISDEL